MIITSNPEKRISKRIIAAVMVAVIFYTLCFITTHNHIDEALRHYIPGNKQVITSLNFDDEVECPHKNLIDVEGTKLAVKPFIHLVCFSPLFDAVFPSPENVRTEVILFHNSRAPPASLI